MSIAAAGSEALSADPSLINTEFIQLLQEQRVLHKREAAFHLAEAEKHGATDEALASMIQAAEKIVAIMLPAATKATAPLAETTAEEVNGDPSWAGVAIAVAGAAAGSPARSELSAPHVQNDLMSGNRPAASGNSWRTRLLGSPA